MPRSSREKSEETRSRIVDTAHRLFVEHGYNAASIRDVSREAGVTIGAIYNHFPTKEDLWKEVLFTKHPYRQILPMIRTAGGRSLPELTHAVAAAMVEILTSHPDLFNLMFTEVVEFKSKHMMDLYALIAPELLKAMEVLAKRDGKLRDIPLNTLLRSFVGLFFSYYATGLLLKGLGGVAIEPQSLDQFVEIFLYGALADDDPSRSRLAPSNRSGSSEA